jgi:hypothetical protein
VAPLEAHEGALGVESVCYEMQGEMGDQQESDSSLRIQMGREKIKMKI